MKSVLITGGLGFIFSHVTEYFVQKGWRVIVVDKQATGSHPEIIDGSFTNYRLDVCRDEIFDVVANEAPDYIIHAAAISDVDDSTRNPDRILEKNIKANVNLFEAARRAKNLEKFLYVSTDEVYGECEVRKKEGDVLAPRNPYSASKAAGSLMHVAYENTYPHMKGRIVESRFCNVFGPRQDARKIMPIIKRALSTGEAVPVFDGGGSYREYIHIENIPPAVELMLEAGEGVYNLTTNDGYRVADLVKKAGEVAGKPVPTTEGHRPGIDMKYQMDAGRVRELGFKPLLSFEEGLAKYLKEGA